MNRIPSALPEVRFVISSAWRGHDDLRESLRDYGFTGEFHPNWRTPLKSECLTVVNRAGRAGEWCRGDEIRGWIISNGFTGRHVILDDTDDFHKGQPLVRTNGWLGLSDDNVDRAIAILNGEDDGK